MNLSPHFTLEEMTRSQLGARYGINNTPNDEQLANLMRTCETMEQVRQLLWSVINVSSGFRCDELNRKVGGAPSSAHRKGLACDFTANGKENYAAAISIRDSGIEFDQLILEYGWIHLGLADAGVAPRRECLTKRSASSPYERGIKA